MTFQDGEPVTDTQPQADGLNPEQRALMERYQSDPAFREQADALWYQGRAAQYAPRQPEPQRESALDRARREYAEAQNGKRELEQKFYRERRDATEQEVAQWNAFDQTEARLDRELTRLEAEDTRRVARELQESQRAAQFQQAVGQAFHAFAQPKINAMNVSAAEKQRLYGKLWELFTTHPFYPQISDVQAAQLLMQGAFNDLVVNHGAPKQRTAQGIGRVGEERNDLDTEQPNGDDPYAEMPQSVRDSLARKYPHKFGAN